MVRTAFRTALIAALLSSTQAFAALLLDNTTASATVNNEQRSPAWGILSTVDVGGANVDIGSFATYGRQVSTGNIKFAVFDQSFARVYVSDAIAAVSSASLDWYVSPETGLTLLANKTYYFGLISDQAFVYHWEYDGGATTANGLTSRAPGGYGANGNFSNFALPTMDDACCVVQQALRLYSAEAAEVPEPAMLGLFGLGALGLGLARRRKA